MLYVTLHMSSCGIFSICIWKFVLLLFIFFIFSGVLLIHLYCDKRFCTLNITRCTYVFICNLGKKCNYIYFKLIIIITIVNIWWWVNLEKIQDISYILCYMCWCFQLLYACISWLKNLISGETIYTYCV